jgi:NADH-quinone oxidoreductase subunit L
VFLHYFDLDHEAHAFHIDPLVAGLATAIALGMVAWAWSMYRGLGFQTSRVQARWPGLFRFIENKFFMDDLYQWIVDKVVMGVGRIVATFDKRVVNEGAVDGSGKVTVIGGTLLRYHETGIVANYVLVTGLTALLIIVAVALL